MTPNWPVEDGYVVDVNGNASFRSRLEPVGLPFDGAVTTAMRVVNTIAAVCLAPPGILNHVGLPFVAGVHTGCG